MVVTREKEYYKKPWDCGEAEKAIGVRGCGCSHSCVRMPSWMRRVQVALVEIGMAHVAPLT
jgi:hypothetical protein